MIKKILWSIVILSLLASFPLIQDRYNSENSSKQVEIVVDNDRIQRLSNRSLEGMSEDDILDFMKQIGVTSIAIHEQAVRDYVDWGIVQLYTTNHLNLFEDGEQLPSNQSLILFSKHLTEEQTSTYQSMIVQSLPEHASPIVWRENQAVLVNKPVSVLQNHIVGFDFDRAQEIKDQGFHLVARVNSTRQWQEAWMETQFAQLNDLGVHTVIFNGRDVLGYPDPDQLEQVAEWFNQYELNLGMIEFHEQTGDKQLSRLIENRVIRLLSVSEQNMNSDSTEKITDMLSLAVLERNTRLVYLNLPFPGNNQPDMEATEVLEKTNTIVHNLYQNIRKRDYELGPASTFVNFDLKESGWQNVVLIIGSLALISLLAAQYSRYLVYFPLPLGLLAYAAARWLDKTVLIHQAFSLAIAIAAPTLATIVIYQWLLKRSEKIKANWLWSIVFFILCSIISLYGAVVTVGLLNGLEFVKYLEQFRGVKILYFMPSVLFAIYLLLHQKTNFLWNQTVSVYNKHIQVKHIIWAALILVAAGYYLSRSGNEAVALPFEIQFRQLLNDVFGVRPRSKEVFIGHPLFLLATYLVLKYKKGAILLIGGIIGQMSIVSTFTHLHTPLLISLERTVYGIVSGAAIGLILILLWNLIERIWRKRERQQTHAE